MYWADAASIRPVQAGYWQLMACLRGWCFDKIRLSTCSALLVERVGRRVLIVLSGLVMASSWAVIAVNDIFGLTSLYWLSITCVIVLIAGYSVGLASLPYVLTSEILPRKGFSLTCGLAITLDWIWIFLTTRGFLTIDTDGSYWFYGITCIVASAATYFVIPETTSKSFLEIAMIFDSPGPSEDDSNVTKSSEKLNSVAATS